jgi:hypothetical protein
MQYTQRKRDWFIEGDHVVDKEGKSFIFQRSQGFDMTQCIDPEDGKLCGVSLPLHFHPDFIPGNTMVAEKEMYNGSEVVNSFEEWIKPGKHAIECSTLEATSIRLNLIDLGYECHLIDKWMLHKGCNSASYCLSTRMFVHHA